MRVIEIWMPRYHDRTVLVAECKVKCGMNFIRFTKDPNRKGLYQLDGDRVRSECEVTSNGKIKCFVVPLGWLEEVETRAQEQAREEAEVFRDNLSEMRIR